MNVSDVAGKGTPCFYDSRSSNHRSILDPVELSMIAVDEDRVAARGFDQLSERVLTVAGIYGPNASGKSTVLEALAWLSFAVRTSLHSWYRVVPRFPHRFGDGPDRPSTFEADFVVDGVRHGYRLEVDDSAVLYESLHSYPERRRRTLFEREGNEISFRRGLSKVGGIQELLTPTTLTLSAAMRLGDPVIGSAGSALAWLNALGLKQQGAAAFFPSERDPSTTMLMAQPGHCMTASGPDPATRRAFVELLRFADPEIDDVAILGGDDPDTSDPRRRLRFRASRWRRAGSLRNRRGVGGDAGVVHPPRAGVLRLWWAAKFCCSTRSTPVSTLGCRPG